MLKYNVTGTRGSGIISSLLQIGAPANQINMINDTFVGFSNETIPIFNATYYKRVM